MGSTDLDPGSPTVRTHYDGNTNDAFFGLELNRVGLVGGYTGGVNLLHDSEAILRHQHNGPTAQSTRAATYNYALPDTHLYPSALPGNQQYDLRGYTYGYVQDKAFSACAAPGQVADIKINLIIGVNVSLNILFKKENIITPTADNMSARVRLFDDSGNLVAEWMSSEGTYTANGFARAADGTTQYPFGNQGDGLSGYDGGANPLPTAIEHVQLPTRRNHSLNVLMAGLPVVPPAGQNIGPTALTRIRTRTSWTQYLHPTATSAWPLRRPWT